MESSSLTYCKEMVRKMDYGRYLQCAFYPPAYVYYALEAELRHIHAHVSEEMIGHIRYAWWQEQIDQLGAAHQKHPVLQLLTESGIEKSLLVRLVESYREAWPELPTGPHPDPLPEGKGKQQWDRAGRIIAAHGNKPRWWLVVRLLFL